MDKKSKILLIIFFLFSLGSISTTFYRYVIKKDYLITAQVPCDIKTESCFYIPCAEGDSVCNSNEIEYYKKIEKKAFNIKLCDPNSDGCNPLVCDKNEKDCHITYCSVDTLGDGEECSISTQ